MSNLFVTGPGIAHEQVPDLTDPMAEYCIFFELLDNQSNSLGSHPSLIKDASLRELLTSNPFWFGQDTGNMMELFEMLANELSLKQLGFHHMVTNILEMIVLRFIRHYSDHHTLKRVSPHKTLDDSRLLYIEKSFLNQYNTITLSQLADRLGISIRQTERAVKKQFGMSFRDKKIQARMSAASRLLLTSHMSISAVATEVGFTTLEQFAYAFKKYFGMTATQYRRENS